MYNNDEAMEEILQKRKIKATPGRILIIQAADHLKSFTRKELEDLLKGTVTSSLLFSTLKLFSKHRLLVEATVKRETGRGRPVIRYQVQKIKI